jgi:hypothetical protein
VKFIFMCTYTVFATPGRTAATMCKMQVQHNHGINKPVHRAHPGRAKCFLCAPSVLLLNFAVQHVTDEPTHLAILQCIEEGKCNTCPMLTPDNSTPLNFKMFVLPKALHTTATTGPAIWAEPRVLAKGRPTEQNTTLKDPPGAERPQVPQIQLLCDRVKDCRRPNSAVHRGFN